MSLAARSLARELLNRNNGTWAETNAKADAIVDAVIPIVRAELAGLIAAEYRKREDPKDYRNLQHQEGYLDALDWAEHVARGTLKP